MAGGGGEEEEESERPDGDDRSILLARKVASSTPLALPALQFFGRGRSEPLPAKFYVSGDSREITSGVLSRLARELDKHESGAEDLRSMMKVSLLGRLFRFRSFGAAFSSAGYVGNMMYLWCEYASKELRVCGETYV